MMKNIFIYPYNWVILLVGAVLLALAIVYLVRYGRRQRGEGPEQSQLDIARERYARGEIGREEFERMKKELE